MTARPPTRSPPPAPGGWGAGGARLALWRDAWATRDVTRLRLLVRELPAEATGLPWFCPGASLGLVLGDVARKRSEPVLLAALGHRDVLCLLAEWSGKPCTRASSPCPHPLLWGVLARSLPVLDAVLACPWPGVSCPPASPSPAPWAEAARIGWREGWARLTATFAPRIAWTTPLHAAALARRPDWVAASLAAGADPCARDYMGRTPLGGLAGLMVSSRRMGGVKLPVGYVGRAMATALELLVAGASLDVPDGRSARSMSIRRRFLAAVPADSLSTLEALLMERVLSAGAPVPGAPARL